MLLLLLCCTVAAATVSPPPDNDYKDQYCTDPRTMKKHKAYTEWADAYSCTRHRCQPGGRNLAIYTVGCKRVEAPESAIECEEVVEDTNMQFPYCCTRLRCLVVVRGEVWTRVLGQPWETLPAAPWSHMYKMKKPPPGEQTFLPKSGPAPGPVYELAAEAAKKTRENNHRALKRSTETPGYMDSENRPEPQLRAAASPDIVIALSTDQDKEQTKQVERRGFKKTNYLDDDAEVLEDTPATEKPSDVVSDEKYYGVTEKSRVWTNVPQNEWEKNTGDLNTTPKQHQASQVNSLEVHEGRSQVPKKKKQSNLQELVDAIGTRMRDIENVFLKMSEKVNNQPDGDKGSERKSSEVQSSRDHDRRGVDETNEEGLLTRSKKPSVNDEYKRFVGRNKSSKYLQSATDATSENPYFVEDTAMSGNFEGKRNNVPKEPGLTYMAPVETRRRNGHSSGSSGESEKKHKKHMHKKKHNKKAHKKHHAKEFEKKNKLPKQMSLEVEQNAVSFEDSGAVPVK